MEVLTAAPRAHIAESPRWHDGALLWVDIPAGAVYCWRDGAPSERCRLGRPVGAALPGGAGATALLTDRGLELLEPSGAVRLLLDVDADAEGRRMNDAAVDPVGRIYAGTMRLDGRGWEGTLYRLELTGAGTWGAHRVKEHLGISNGIGWSPDATTMYHVDSGRRTLFAHPYDVERALLGPGRPILTTSLGTAPDGLQVLADGTLLVAVYGASEIRHIDPHGALIGAIPVPTPLVTSCVVSPTDPPHLYVTTAMDPSSKQRRDPLAGHVFVDVAPSAPMPSSLLPF